ncbi:MAG: DUF447 family protein [Candidatus Bathyarchaeia archaeon]|nr:DUF447 family protein [Candidatus Bathyarchaeota archaeon]
MNIQRFNLRKNRIYEAVVSVYNENKEPTAAPMGVTIINNLSFFIKPFKQASLLKKLMNSKCGVANFTLNPTIFYLTAFKEKNPGGKLPLNLFKPATYVNAPKLKTSILYIEFTVNKILNESVDRVKIECNIEGIEEGNEELQPYCRGLFAALECVIHATRVKKYLLEKNFSEAEKLIQLILYYNDLINRVAPQTDYANLVKTIIEDCEEWRRRAK